MEPALEEDFEFVWNVTGGNIPTEFKSAIEKGFKRCLEKGRLIGFPVVNMRFVVEDGASHSVDSSDTAFQSAARGAFRAAYPKAKPSILEPIMKVAVEGPGEFQGSILRTINQRRGMILGTHDDDGFCRVEAEVPLGEMFGYSTVLRSGTKGQAEYTMEFAKYATVPSVMARKLREEFEGVIPLGDDD